MDQKGRPSLSPVIVLNSVGQTAFFKNVSEAAGGGWP